MYLATIIIARQRMEKLIIFLFIINGMHVSRENNVHRADVFAGIFCYADNDDLNPQGGKK
jgi:hypothetical protein